MDRKVKDVVLISTKNGPYFDKLLKEYIKEGYVPFSDFKVAVNGNGIVWFAQQFILYEREDNEI